MYGFASNVAITCDTGWTSSQVRRRVSMVQYWNRLVAMSDDRLTKQVFLWDYQVCRNNWSYGMKRLFSEIEERYVFDNIGLLSKERAWAKLHENFCRNWSRSLHNSPKLRTYCLYKELYCIEPYVSCNMGRKYRSALARFRSGTLLLEIETGRWRGIPVDQRLCKLCNTQSVESESHFLFSCPVYDQLRDEHFERVRSMLINFNNFNEADKLKALMQPEFVAGTARLVSDMYNARQNMLFQSP